jgi:hypothetical protein
VEHLVFAFVCVVVYDAHLIWSDYEAPVSRGEGFAEAEEGEEVEISDRPLNALNMPAHRALALTVSRRC